MSLLSVWYVRIDCRRLLHYRGWLIIYRMIINLNESQVRALDQVRAILDGTHALDFEPAANPDERCRWVAAVLQRFRYRQLKRANRGLLLRYIRRFSGFSRAHVTRLVRRWMLGHKLRSTKLAPANAFAQRYTDEDLHTLAEAEREYGRLCGPAMTAVLRRMYQLYGDEQFVRLQYLSPWLCQLVETEAERRQERTSLRKRRRGLG
jgi:hypothetical protein